MQRKTLGVAGTEQTLTEARTQAVPQRSSSEPAGPPPCSCDSVGPWFQAQPSLGRPRSRSHPRVGHRARPEQVGPLPRPRSWDYARPVCSCHMRPLSAQRQGEVCGGQRVQAFGDALPRTRAAPRACPDLAPVSRRHWAAAQGWGREPVPSVGVWLGDRCVLQEDPLLPGGLAAETGSAAPAGTAGSTLTAAGTPGVTVADTPQPLRDGVSGWLPTEPAGAWGSLHVTDSNSSNAGRAAPSPLRGGSLGRRHRHNRALPWVQCPCECRGR